MTKRTVLFTIALLLTFMGTQVIQTSAAETVPPNLSSVHGKQTTKNRKASKGSKKHKKATKSTQPKTPKQSQA